MVSHPAKKTLSMVISDSAYRKMLGMDHAIEGPVEKKWKGDLNLYRLAIGDHPCSSSAFIHFQLPYTFVKRDPELENNSNMSFGGMTLFIWTSLTILFCVR